ncbi:MAG: hypothetical protein LC799_01785, partial [Actinobacteria bacterium]|nr:hypothetical protein [Actinomycetota bacterium]
MNLGRGAQLLRCDGALGARTAVGISACVADTVMVRFGACYDVVRVFNLNFKFSLHPVLAVP